MAIFQIQDQTACVLALYKHPNQSFKDFWCQFKKFMRESIPDIENQSCQTNVFILGDFNINSDKEVQLKDKILNKFNFQFVNPNGFTTDRKTTIDWIITNTKTIEYKTYIYESFFSDHKPLWLSIKKKKKQIIEIN